MGINFNLFENPTDFDFSGYYDYKRYKWPAGEQILPYDARTLDIIHHLRQPRAPELDNVTDPDGTPGRFHESREVPEGGILPGQCGIDELLVYIGHRFYKWLSDMYYRAIPGWILDDSALEYMWSDPTGTEARLETGTRAEFRAFLDNRGHRYDFLEFTAPLETEVDETEAERRFQALKSYVRRILITDRSDLPSDAYLKFVSWLVTNYHYSGENILYSPAYPDIIYSLETNRRGGQDSPAVRIPPIIAYLIRKRAPLSKDGIPFGTRKDYKWNYAGQFRDANGEVRTVRFRRWDNLVEFTTIWNSGLQANTLCGLFEQFLEANEGWFLKAGMGKMIPFGRVAEQEPLLSNSGVSYRKTLWYFATQEFQISDPVTTITDVDVDVLPVGSSSSTSDSRILDISLSGVVSFSP